MIAFSQLNLYSSGPLVGIRRVSEAKLLRIILFAVPKNIQSREGKLNVDCNMQMSVSRL